MNTDKEMTRLRKESKMLHDLLAYIHRDGGRYIDEHGIDEAFTKAVSEHIMLANFYDASRDDVL